eukprot:COSAG02_NODE_8694_length_2477_cov_2.194281_3_plen_99_part_00
MTQRTRSSSMEPLQLQRYSSALAVLGAVIPRMGAGRCSHHRSSGVGASSTSMIEWQLLLLLLLLFVGIVDASDGGSNSSDSSNMLGMAVGLVSGMVAR